MKNSLIIFFFITDAQWIFLFSVFLIRKLIAINKSEDYKGESNSERSNLRYTEIQDLSEKMMIDLIINIRHCLRDF